MSSAIATLEPALDVVVPVRHTTDPHPPATRRPKPPGPGLPESILWTLGFVVLQVIAAVICYAVQFFFLTFAAGLRNEPMPALDNLGSMEVQLTAVATATLAMLMLVGLGWWRLGRSAGRKLNLSMPNLKQTVILASMVLPLMLVSGTAYELVDAALQWLTPHLPWLAALNQVNGVPHIENEIAQLPLLLSLFSVAVLPALGEEFLCRGLIGRGLVARWGIVRGVLLTSILFGLLHLYPPHVASAFVLGIVVHVVYLATRSFWAPVLYHFLNNATVVVVSSLFLSQTATEEAAGINGFLVAGALAYVLFALAMLWRYRTVYVDGEGMEQSPGFPSVSAPARDSLLVRTAPRSRLALGAFSLIFALIIGALAIDVAGSLKATESEAGPAAMTDAAISELLIGQWDSGTQFHADGTFASAGPLGDDSEPIVIQGVWDVANGVLRAEVTTSGSPQIAPGTTLYWEVVSIDTAACEYRTADGEIVVERRVIALADEPVAARG